MAVSGSMSATLGAANPLRYRGYVYDSETSLYYLSSRYYNPVWGRFINADTAAVVAASPDKANWDKSTNPVPVEYTHKIAAYRINKGFLRILYTPKNYELLIRNTPPEISRQLRKCYSTVLAYKADR